MAQKTLCCTRWGNLLVATEESANRSDAPTSIGPVSTFECQPCRLRFRLSQEEITSGGTGQDRRASPRVPVQVPVELECGTLVGEGTGRDIPKGGCAVESRHPLTIGQLLRLKFPPPTGSMDDCTTQKIATVQDIRGQKAGMKFLAFTPNEQTRLTRTVTKAVQYFPPSDKRS